MAEKPEAMGGMSAWDKVLNPGRAVSESLMAAPVDEADVLGGGFGLPSAEALAAGLSAEQGNFRDPSEPMTAAEKIAALLEATATDMLPRQGRFEYGVDRLPHWVPGPLAQVLRNHPRAAQRSGYDPYMGTVYMGQEDFIKKTEVPTETGEDAEWGAAKGIETKTVRKRKKRDDVLTAENAGALPYTWEEDEVQSAMARFREAGINVTSFDQLVDAWGGLVNRASAMYSLSKGERKVTPWDVLELQKREAAAAGSLVNYENGTVTEKATSVAEISEGSAWMVLRNTLSTLLGRDPSDRELRDYSYRMNTLAAKNPSVTETITRYQAGEVVGTSEHKTPGFGPDDMAQAAYEGAQNNPEYAKVQAGTTYYNALLQAIGAVGDV